MNCMLTHGAQTCVLFILLSRSLLASPPLPLPPLFLLLDLLAQALVWEERTKRGFNQWVDQEQMLKYAKSRGIAPNGLSRPTDQRFSLYRTKFEEGLLFNLFGAA